MKKKVFIKKRKKKRLIKKEKKRGVIEEARYCARDLC
jgi:hypothetical protein